MAHPYHHALSSVKKWGGTVDDYMAVHQLVVGSIPTAGANFTFTINAIGVAAHAAGIGIPYHGSIAEVVAPKKLCVVGAPEHANLHPEKQVAGIGQWSRRAGS